MFYYLALCFYFVYYQTVFPIDFTQSFCMPGENNAAKINIWYTVAVYSWFIANNFVLMSTVDA